MTELEITWARTTRIWWSLVWRGLLFGFLSGFVAGFIVGFLGGMLRLDPQIARALGILAALIVGIPVGLWIVKNVLGKKFKGFRIALVVIPET